jgi:hypothetical protein
MEQKKFTKVKYDTIFKLLSEGKVKKDYKIENNQLYYKNLKVILSDEKKKKKIKLFQNIKNISRSYTKFI